MICASRRDARRCPPIVCATGSRRCPACAWSARDSDGTVAGAIRYWPIRIGETAALLLGPVAVHPTHQGEGLGALLIEQSLEAAQAAGWERVMLVGDAPYYNRFGFTKLDEVEMPPPTNPDRVLGRDLAPGAWQGVKGHVTRWSEAG